LIQALKPLTIGKYTIKSPIIQGGMGVGVSWDSLAGNVSLNGGLGVISSVGTGYYKNQQFSNKLVAQRPYQSKNFYSSDGLFDIFKNARKICGDLPLACNVLYASNDYGKIVTDACKAGADMIITGAGLPTRMPEFTKNFPDVALIPIVSSARAFSLICRKWKKHNKLPDAVIVEGPLSGGHQGFTYEQCGDDAFSLENILSPIIEEVKKWGNIPVIAAGGIWDKIDINKFIKMGCSGVQMATRFIGTYECDAHQNFKDILIKAKAKDIQLFKSPVGLPARGVRTNLQNAIENKTAPKVTCISNCVAPCNRGVEAKLVGYCIADALSDAQRGITDTGLFFTGSNGYKIKKLLSVKELMHKLTQGENA
jgi:nitronate monooxygenase